MKKLMLQFAEGLLSKEQMKKVRGGCGSNGNCSVSCGNYGPVSYSVSGCDYGTVSQVCGPDVPYYCYCN
jgi:hypothetical protein